eukprot:comp8980_c0_seq1/m.4182 comp8980_c0_seq1/g.4182  ORF comp8980_c0_seq1/g.4182 comp8980_c0_seq1/m.4182 type:complete len:337 (-) comp8980_c0_seq1:720-1730(-)
MASLTLPSLARMGLLRAAAGPLALAQMRALHTTVPVLRATMSAPTGSFSTQTPETKETNAKQTTAPSATVTVKDSQAGYETVHFNTITAAGTAKEYTLAHPIWTAEECDTVNVTHREPKGFVDKLAYGTVQACRKGFDIVTGYDRKPMTEDRWLTRIVFLETVAGVPGMVAAMTRHLHSLRRLRRDHGWIHTLLEEAENERMHLLTAMTMKKPGLFMRSMIIGAQGVFVTGFSLAYLLSPRFCHRFVGYLEEEAVKTYTHCLKELDAGKLPMWQNTIAPEVARNYWKLPEDASMRDLIAQIRADEAHHRVVNHNFSDLAVVEKKTGVAVNPYGPGR